MQSVKAFSLTETLVAIGIISVLATAAVVAHIRYTNKAQLTNAMQQLEYYVRAVQNYYIDYNIMPGSITDLGETSATINNITISLSQTSSTEVKLNAKFDNKAPKQLRNQILTITMALNIDSGFFKITCTAPGIEKDILPSSCK